MTVSPVTPEEVRKPHKRRIDNIVEIFNEFIISEWDGEESVVYQRDVLKAIKRKFNYTSSTIFEKHYLDVERIFERQGWKVTYELGEKEGYYFSFTKKDTEKC